MPITDSPLHFGRFKCGLFILLVLARFPGAFRADSHNGWVVSSPVEPFGPQRHTACLLYYMRKLMRRELEVARVLTCAEIDIRPTGERFRPNILIHLCGFGAGMHTHVTEIHPKTWLHIPSH